MGQVDRVVGKQGDAEFRQALNGEVGSGSMMR